MKLKSTVIGIVFILVALWFYTALSSFEVEEGFGFKKIVIEEGIVRTIDEVAMVLAKENGFDLEGAYKEGYTSHDIVGYLIEAPHEYHVTLYKKEYYEGRKTILYIFPLLVCIFIAILGVGVILPKRKLRK